MAHKLTLQTLAENLIRESRKPFSVDEYIETIQNRWRRRIAPRTLDHLKQTLTNHSHVIEVGGENFLPYQAVLDRVGHIPLELQLGKSELERQLMIPGHQLVPFISPDLEEEELTFLDINGREIPKRKQKFFIDEVINHYQYAHEKHFPYQINVNQWMPGKSTLNLTVWDIRDLLAQLEFHPEDRLKVKLKDYYRGIYAIEAYPARQWSADRLRTRSLNIALEEELMEGLGGMSDSALSLEKQVLQGLFHLDVHLLETPAFSLTGLVESLQKISVVRNEDAGVYFARDGESPVKSYILEGEHHTPQGRTGSLQEIFEDMGLAFSELEFKAILYSMMGTEDFNLEQVFDLLFGAKKDCFYDEKQHQAFYRMLRKMLNLICDELKGPEPRLISQLRSKIVYMKLRLIEMLRFIEAQQVCLEDLPEEVLEHMADLDGFCMEGLHHLSDRPEPPDLKTIHDLRIALQMVQPNLDYLEETIFYRLGVY
ncbi:MAG: hypothetical protein OEZ51_07720 [Nitrospinota bacterium]|nr:hypothetical protein [Nitrospinota bacterium]